MVASEVQELRDETIAARRELQAAKERYDDLLTGLQNDCNHPIIFEVQLYSSASFEFQRMCGVCTLKEDGTKHTNRYEILHARNVDLRKLDRDFDTYRRIERFVPLTRSVGVDVSADGIELETVYLP